MGWLLLILLVAFLVSRRSSVRRPASKAARKLTGPARRKLRRLATEKGNAMRALQRARAKYPEHHPVVKRAKRRLAKVGK